MPSLSQTRVLPYTPQQVFDLVINIEKYPEFLPWCRAARIFAREADGTFLGELVIRFSHLTERYTSRVVGIAPTNTKEGSIHVSLVEGPFHHLTNHWRFAPHPDGCTVDFMVNFAFKSTLLTTLIGGVFTRASEKMIDAFLSRAKQLYG